MSATADPLDRVGGTPLVTVTSLSKQRLAAAATPPSTPKCCDSAGAASALCRPRLVAPHPALGCRARLVREPVAWNDAC